MKWSVRSDLWALHGMMHGNPAFISSPSEEILYQLEMLIHIGMFVHKFWKTKRTESGDGDLSWRRLHSHTLFDDDDVCSYQ